MGGHRHFKQGFFAAVQRGFHVTLEYGGEGLLLFPFRMFRGERLDPVEDVEGLEVHRLLGPQAAVVVEGGDTRGGVHVVGGAGRGDLVDKGNDGLFGRVVVPGRQGIRRERMDQEEADEGEGFHGVVGLEFRD